MLGYWLHRLMEMATDMLMVSMSNYQRVSEYLYCSLLEAIWKSLSSREYKTPDQFYRDWLNSHPSASEGLIPQKGGIVRYLLTLHAGLTIMRRTAYRVSERLLARIF